LAVQRVVEGYPVKVVAGVLGVSACSVRRWLRAFRESGFEALAARPVPGRRPKLTRVQEKIALHWLDDKPSDHGFDSDLWTGARFAEMIRDEWGVDLNHRYICRWLSARGFSPQRPERVPRERDSQAIAAWLDSEWERIKKKRRARADASFSLTKAGF
jgi:transposase